MTVRVAPRLPHMRCPHCQSRAFARTSGKEATTYKEIYYHCRNDLECGHVFMVSMQVLRTIRPSACPDPTIILPVSRYSRTATALPEPA